MRERFVGAASGVTPVNASNAAACSLRSRALSASST